MKARALMLVLGLAAALPWARVDAARHALLIGVSDYTDPRVPDLEGPRHDVAAMREVLATRWGFEEANITVLVDADATEEAILQALRRLRETPADDEILVYFSGHGTSASDPDLGAHLNLPDGSGAIAAVDFDPDRIDRLSLRQPAADGLLVGRYELRPAFEALDQTHSTLVIFDACFSGNAARALPSPWTPRQTRQLSLLGRIGNALLGKQSAESENFNYRNTVYFGAAAEHQLAVDFSQAEIDAGIVSSFDGKPHGGFSDSLLRALHAYSGDTGQPTRARLFNHVRKQFSLHCQVCGHDPVSLPAINPPGSTLLDQPFLTLNGTPATHPEPPVERGDDTLRIAAADTAIAALPRSLQTRLTDDTRVPDVYFETDGDSLLALGADGRLLREFTRGQLTSDHLTDWASTRTWLKRRAHRDARQASGELRVEFRHPVLGMTVHEGDLLQFEAQYPHDAHIAMLLVDASGALSVLYPATPAEMHATLKAGDVFRFPAPGAPAIAVTPPWGTDTLLFYALPVDFEYHDTLLALARQPHVALNDPALARVERWLDESGGRYGALQLRIAAEPWR